MNEKNTLLKIPRKNVREKVVTVSGGGESYKRTYHSEHGNRLEEITWPSIYQRSARFKWFGTSWGCYSAGPMRTETLPPGITMLRVIRSNTSRIRDV